MSRRRVDDLLNKSISPSSVRTAGTLTVPASYGVYRVTGNQRSGREYRFGNHPIRGQELVNQYGGASLVALFLERELAKELSDLLNR